MVEKDVLYTLIDEDQESKLVEAFSEKAKEIDMVDILIDEEIQQQEEKVIEDTKKTAVKMAFVGAGQGGGNLADMFYQMGYRNVVAINSTDRDMQRLKIPAEARYILKGNVGAGKDPSIGRKLVESESEEIFKLLQSNISKDVEQILICVGLGGGTGNGASIPLVKISKDYLESVGRKDGDKCVGLIVTLPTKDESAAVQKNALEALMPLIEMAEAKQISPLVIVDNAKVMSLYGKSSILDVWGKANKNIAALFDVFNSLCALNDESVLVTCDPQDYRTVLQSGIITFGRTKIEKVEKVSDIADAVRENVKKGLLVEGLDISKATCGAGILAGGNDELANISQEAFEAAFGSLNRLMHQGPETKLHRGVYVLSAGSVYCYTILGGLGAPADRIAEMKKKAGI